MQPYYSHSKASDRLSIQALMAAKFSCRAIARQLNFYHSSVCREVNRAKACATASAASYCAGRAQVRSVARRAVASAARRKLGTDLTTPLWRTVLDGLRCRWSPEQIADKLPHKRNLNPLRPPEVAARIVPGHREGDLIKGAMNRSSVGTLVERSSRYVILVKLDGFKRRLKSIPESTRKTMTYDQGSEMALHETLSAKLNMDIFFCDPHSPWQRGSNENANGLIREFLPKGMDLSVVSHQQLTSIEHALNRRPCKILDSETPHEAFSRLSSQSIAGVALQA